MYKVLVKIVIISLFGLLLTSCKKKLFLEDISDRKVELLSPGNGVKLRTSQVTFKWTEINDITSYNFQLATPKFDAIELLLIDIDTALSQLTLTLTPGQYEWRVRATNDRYTTDYSAHHLTIDSSSSLQGFQVVLTSPADQAYTNLQPTFNWEKSSQVNNYNFKIVAGLDFQNGALFTSIVSTTDNSLNLSRDLSSGEYTWGVNAEDDISKSTYVTRILNFDDVAPKVPALSKPIDNTTLADGKVAFDWNQTPDEGAPFDDTLRIYTDTQLTNLLKQIDATSTGVSDSLSAGVYYWTISRGDKAGNYGGQSSAFKFTIP